jgi:hypothetical protein
MASIGPQIPSHLLKPRKEEEEEEEDEDAWVPELPPDLVKARSVPTAPSTSPVRRPVGPTFPNPNPKLDDDSDDEEEEDIGPKPLPTASSHASKAGDGVWEFMEKEERRRKLVEEAAKPKKLQRDEWMLVPPTSGDLLSCASPLPSPSPPSAPFVTLTDVDRPALDPTKLRPRQFRATAAPPAASSASGAGNLWTETPGERQQRLADEVLGKKRRAVDGDGGDEGGGDGDGRAEAERKAKRRRDEEIRRGVEEHTVRSPFPPSHTRSR